MRTERNAHRLVRGAILLFLLSPYVAWLGRAPIPAWPPNSIFAPLPTAFLTSAVSTLASLALGFAWFRGLRHPLARWGARSSLVLPGAIPPLFLALALFQLWPGSGVFPFGLGAVVFAHALIFGGLVAVALKRLDDARLARAAEVAWAMGVDEVTYWTKIAAPMVAGDLVALAFFIFTACWTSFSIPLLLRGPGAATLDVAIYDLIRLDGRWDYAFTLAALQAGGLLAVAMILPRGSIGPRGDDRSTRAYPPSRWWYWATFLPGALCVAGLGRAAGRPPLLNSASLVEAWLTTAAIGAGAGALTFVLGLGLGFALPHPRLERWLFGHVAPGSVLTGFGWALIGGPPLPRLIAALTLVSFAPLYRWQLHGAFAELREQWRVARSLGANARQILVEITWPQAAPALLGAAGLAAVWAAGDFALGDILIGGEQTLPRIIADRLAHYDASGAIELVGPLALTALALYAFFAGLARVAVAKAAVDRV